MSSQKTSGKFLYFAYGSNLLSHRIYINNPSAVRAGPAKLKDYKLDFVTYSKRWRGASATIVPKKGSEVWGALWEIDNIHMESLDRQEGVHENIYVSLTVEVENPDGQIYFCRTYQQTAEIDEEPELKTLPDHRKPSTIYLKTILKGAQESELPHEYKKFLDEIPHNGYDGEVDIGLPLNVL